ncbi:hypothetical protein [Yoonia sp. 208BN28-4]|uniref:hypothetical protein n=1 Tax=Yoonia sp. 208BN28-4 TaxID=3126505 RepID=UPI0030AE5EFC
MTDNVVDMDRSRRKSAPKPVATDFWFAQLDVRLSRIELLVSRLEMQMLMIACGAFALLVLEMIALVRGT